MQAEPRPGVSGVSLFLPRYRVPLQRWCEWTGAPWDKIQTVVGRSFRVCGPRENAYTMAAGAVLRLINNYDIDPREVGFLGLGTESSTDNAAGAVIVKGMVNDALRQMGKPELSRECEVPEFKHACLGGVYGMKAGLRYLAYDGQKRKAIVVSSDIAEYARGSTGEQTQGAGAVAFLLESRPKLFEVDLPRGGSASDYRGIDFRKPFARHFMPDYGDDDTRKRDFPVFNGKYSTLCYIDEVVHALDDMFHKLETPRRAFYDSLAGIFFHRPYHHLPIQALAAALIWGMGRSEDEREELRGICQEAGVDYEGVLAEIRDSPNLFEHSQAKGIDVDPFAEANKVAKLFRKSPWFKAMTKDKLTLGNERVRELGNLYTASLPAWLGAGLEDAAERDLDLANRPLLAVGYGSGDAAEAIPLRVSPMWKEAAQRIGFRDALADPIDLDQAQYEALHDGREVGGAADEPVGGFVIDRVGQRNDPNYQDIGVEYYRWCNASR